MKFKTIDDFNVRGKKILLRVDLNSEVEGGKVVLNERIIEHAKTIAELKMKGARVIVLAHQSSPGKKDFISLKQHARLLNKFTRIKFADDIIGARAVSEIPALKNGEAILLENVRFLKDEFNLSRKNVFVNVLGKECDIYLNDAFSVSHRAQASVVLFAGILPSGIGRVMQRELESLAKIDFKNVLHILGGSKEDNILLMNKKKILTCGIFGQLCLVAKGYDLGKQNKFLAKQIREVVPKLKKVVFGARTPIDFAVRVNGRRRELPLQEFPSRYEIFDIGSRTIKMYCEKIKNADAIFMKGTAGYCEDAKFCVGTRALLNAVARARGFTVLSGGHLGSALRKFRISRKKFGYVSLSGGAAVWYLAGRELPGLAALERNN